MTDEATVAPAPAGYRSCGGSVLELGREGLGERMPR
jgi:hypothetical protein